MALLPAISGSKTAMSAVGGRTILAYPVVTHTH
jgi:hypothetical protein